MSVMEKNSCCCFRLALQKYVQTEHDDDELDN